MGRRRTIKGRQSFYGLAVLSLVHFLFGFVFVLIDTDSFKAELNPFTAAWLMDRELVFRLYTYLFLGYFLGVAFLSFSSKAVQSFKWLGFATLAYLMWSMIMLYSNGQLFKPVASQEPRIVGYLFIVAVASGGRNSTAIWLRKFGYGAFFALFVRLIAHWFGAVKNTDIVLGAETLGFYGTFNAFLNLAASLGFVGMIVGVARRDWKLFGISLIVAGLSFGVLGSGFRRSAILKSIIVPAVGTLAGFWIMRKSLAGIAVFVGVGLASVIAIIAITVASFGLDASLDRLKSLTNPFEDSSASTRSNEAYLDDWQHFPKIVAKNPLGVGYGNSYGVTRVIDMYMSGSDSSESEVPLHIGFFELIARTGIFGAALLGAIIATIVKILFKLRGRLKFDEALAAGVIIIYLLYNILFPLAAPQTNHIKIMGLYAILIGFLSNLTVVRERRKQNGLKNRRISRPMMIS